MNTRPEDQKTRIVLLPGLHGTVQLFDRVIAAAPSEVGEPVIIAESFSGRLHSLSRRVAQLLRERQRHA